MTSSDPNITTAEKHLIPKSGVRDVTFDQAVVARLLTSEYSGLLSLVRRKIKDRDVAIDLLNEAIVVTLNHARTGRFAQAHQIGGYVFQVTMNLLRNHRRNIHNREDLRSNVETLDTYGLYDSDDVELSQAKNRARLLIESLASPRDRELIKRFYLDEEDKESICRDLAITPLIFTQVMSRARQKMRSAFESEGLKTTDFFSLVAL